MKTLVLTGHAMGDAAAMHRCLKEKLQFPSWYGANLDALWDLLGERQNLRLILTQPAAMDPAQCSALVALLEEWSQTGENRFFEVAQTAPQVGFAPSDTTPPAALAYAVVAARCQGDWVFCRHRNRQTWEMPGGHIEPGESPLAAARRELAEEAGIAAGALWPVCLYWVQRPGGDKSWGALYGAQVPALCRPNPAFEMAEARLFADGPPCYTHPYIQPLLLEKAGQCWPAEAR